jgi:hypothetical protein
MAPANIDALKHVKKVNEVIRRERLARLKKERAERPENRKVLASLISQIAQTKTSRLNALGIRIYFDRLQEAENALKTIPLPRAEKEKFVRELTAAITKSREA